MTEPTPSFNGEEIRAQKSDELHDALAILRIMHDDPAAVSRDALNGAVDRVLNAASSDRKGPRPETVLASLVLAHRLTVALGLDFEQVAAAAMAGNTAAPAIETCPTCGRILPPGDTP